MLGMYGFYARKTVRFQTDLKLFPSAVRLLILEHLLDLPTVRHKS